MAHSSTRRLALLLIVAGLLATACARSAVPQDTLSPAGPQSRHINALFWPVFWIAVVVFFLVAGLVVGFCIKFRARPDNERPRQIHGSTKIEIAWTIVPALLMIGVGVASVTGIFYLFRVPKGAPITVQVASATSGTMNGEVLHVNVIAHRWWFEFRYPGLGANGHDLVTAGEMHIPAGKNVYLDITSNEPTQSVENASGHVGDGVIHNFWIPKLGGKIYAVPGLHNHLTLNADQPGTYVGQCSEFCGISHANMRARAVAQTQDEFAAWVANQQQQARVYTDADGFAAPDALAGSRQFSGAATCSVCHTVDGTSVGLVGPNLTHLQARNCFAGCILATNDANLRLWLRNPQAVKPGANMRIPKLTEDQITALIAYLDTLK